VECGRHGLIACSPAPRPTLVANTTIALTLPLDLVSSYISATQTPSLLDPAAHPGGNLTSGWAAGRNRTNVTATLPNNQTIVAHGPSSGRPIAWNASVPLLHGTGTASAFATGHAANATRPANQTGYGAAPATASVALQKTPPPPPRPPTSTRASANATLISSAPLVQGYLRTRLLICLGLAMVLL
jgi:hypothetical protein